MKKKYLALKLEFGQSNYSLYSNFCQVLVSHPDAVLIQNMH